MIDTIYWHYYGRGSHLVEFVSGRKLKLTSLELTAEFTLGQLKKRWL